MSVENTATDLVDDGIVVHDEAPSAEEEQKAHDDIVSKVSKMFTPDDESEEPGQSAAEQSSEPGKPEKADEVGESAQLSDELKALVEGAGLSEDLAQRLHQSGQLEETLSAFDRRMIDHVQSKEPTTDSNKDESNELEEEADEVPALDPELYDEELVKQIDILSKQNRELAQRLDALDQGQQGGFDEWFDGELADLGVDVKDNDKCQSVFKAYNAICDAFDKDPNGRDKALVQRAYAAMYPQDVFKQQQRQTVNRLRDAEGKFLTKAKSSGSPPPKEATEEERNSQLISDVAAYLKEQGVEMSGY